MMRRSAPTVRFRDLSDLATPIPNKTDESADKGVAQSDGVAPQPGTQPAARSDNTPDSWENDAGFDEEIEAPPRGPRNGFPMAAADGVNLNEPCLRDLLSDDPVPGVIERGQQCAVSSATRAASGNSPSTGPLRAEQFKF
ncbi:hypothetical protein FRC08_011166 [Ceratobasidium sp. 394]|nr:hypothetical protein FRC08_011166 [Ceratobasidium sp. 394]